MSKVDKEKKEALNRLINEVIHVLSHHPKGEDTCIDSMRAAYEEYDAAVWR